MFCTNCGTQFEGIFCPNCGKKVGDKAEQESQQPRELQILRNARDCFTRLEDGNVRLEMALAEEIYINDLIAAKQEELNQINLELEKLDKTAGGISAGKAALALYTGGASLLFTGIHKNKDKNKKYLAAKDEVTTKVRKLEEEIEELKEDCFARERQAQIIYKESKELLASDKWKEAKTMINPSYFDVESVTSLIEYLIYGRASTWKEACNLLEDERYKATMITLNAAQLSVQQQMAEAQNELIDLTMESIDLQKQELNVQLESSDLQRQSIEVQKQQIMQAYKMNDFLGKQLEEMQKIRKNTKKTARAAKLSAFLNTLDALTVDSVKIRL